MSSRRYTLETAPEIFNLHDELIVPPAGSIMMSWHGLRAATPLQFHGMLSAPRMEVVVRIRRRPTPVLGELEDAPIYCI